MSKPWDNSVNTFGVLVSSKWTERNEYEAKRLDEATKALTPLLEFLHDLNAKLQSSLGDTAGVKISELEFGETYNHCILPVDFRFGDKSKIIRFNRQDEQILFNDNYYNISQIGGWTDLILQEVRKIYLTPDKSKKKVELTYKPFRM